MTPIAAPVAGLVLAGGRSRRFGREKALAAFHGRALMLWSIAALRAVCGGVAVSAREGSGAEALAKSLGLAVLRDDPGHPSGPLAGVAAGLAWAARAGCAGLVTLPCDTPGVTGAHLGPLAAALFDAPAAYAVTSGGPHPLCAAWRTDLAARLIARLAGGEHPPVRALLAELDARAVVFDDAGAFMNFNTQGALDDAGPAETG